MSFQFDYDLTCWEGRFRWLISYVDDGFLKWNPQMRAVSKGIHDECGCFIYYRERRWSVEDHWEVGDGRRYEGDLIIKTCRTPIMHNIKNYRYDRNQHVIRCWHSELEEHRDLTQYSQRLEQLFAIPSYRKGALLLADQKCTGWCTGEYQSNFWDTVFDCMDPTQDGFLLPNVRPENQRILKLALSVGLSPNLTAVPDESHFFRSEIDYDYDEVKPPVSALWIAIERFKDPILVDMLLEAKSDPNCLGIRHLEGYFTEEKPISMLYFVIAGGESLVLDGMKTDDLCEIVDSLLRHKADPFWKQSKSTESMLQIAVADKLPARVVEALVAAGLDPFHARGDLESAAEMNMRGPNQYDCLQIFSQQKKNARREVLKGKSKAELIEMVLQLELERDGADW